MQEINREKVVTLPNILTFIRIGTIPVLIGIMHLPGVLWAQVAGVLFMLAGLTDLFDGMIARRMHMESTLGRFLDPVADKLLVTSLLIMLVGLGRAEAWMAIAIICREIMVTGLRAVAANQNMQVPSDNFGKCKTALQMAAIMLMVLHYPLGEFDPQVWGERLLWAAMALTIYSGFSYFLRFERNLLSG